MLIAEVTIIIDDSKILKQLASYGVANNGQFIYYRKLGLPGYCVSQTMTLIACN